MSKPGTRLAIFAAIGLVLAAVACTSTQPDQVLPQTASLSFSATAVVNNNNCWEKWLDTDSNGVPDQNTGQFYCEPVTGDVKQTRPVPWPYSLQVSLIKAGETNRQLICSNAPVLPCPDSSSVVPDDGVNDFISMTGYDPAVETGGTKPPVGNLYYLNGVRVSNGSEYWLDANGYSFAVDPNVLMQMPTYEFMMNPGDTVVVEARKQSYADGPTYLPTDQDPDLKLFAVLKLGGSPVLVNGTSFSSGDDKSGFTFSFTRR